MLTLRFSFALTLLVAAFGGTGDCSAAAPDRPNVIVIFTDDQGYQDLGCFGAEQIRTPRIDQLAAEGIRLTSFYSAASVCTPSRAALLTGCYPERVGNLPVLFPHSDRGLSLAETTIAELLKEQGYATACVGKWHLGHHPEMLPTEHGFDEYFGIPYSNDMNADGLMELADDVQFLEGADQEQFRAGVKKGPPLMRGKQVIEWPADQTQLTRRYTQEVQRFIREHAAEPFFVYLPHTMPHVPLYASDEFRGRSDSGLYGDTIEEIDWSVGQILDTLAELNIDQNTLIIYTSDNGPWNFPGNVANRTKGNSNRRVGGSADPLRGHKFSTWEGGMRVPCVVRWPARIPAGAVCDEVTATIDLLPTIAEAADAPLPGRTIDGQSLMNLLEGQPEAASPHDAFFYRTAGVRSGKWKLIGGKLFDLEQDISETTDRATEYPEVVARLAQRLAEHRREMNEQGRPPAYHARPPYPMASLPDWTVESGQWRRHRDDVLRQGADWTHAKATSPQFDAPATTLEVEGRLTENGAGWGIALLDAAVPSRRIEVTIRYGEVPAVVIDAGADQQATIPIDDAKLAVWRRLGIEIKDSRCEVRLNGSVVHSMRLPAAFVATHLALLVDHAKADFRDLSVRNAAGTLMLEVLPTP